MRLKRLLCLILAAALLLSGCAVSPEGRTDETTAAPSDTAASPDTGKQTGVSAFGLAYVPEYGFNPFSCTCITNRPVLSLVYEPLFVLGSNFQPEPVLCDRFAVSETARSTS